MNKQELFQQRMDNFMKTVNRQDPDYVPVMAHPAPGVAVYANTTYKESLKDDVSCVGAMTKIFEELYSDCTISHMVTILPRAGDVLGGCEFTIGPDGTTLQHVQNSLMKDDEYPLFIENMDGYVQDVLLPRKFPALFQDDLNKVKDALKIVLEDMGRVYANLNIKIVEKLANDYAIPTITDDRLYVKNPLDVLFNSFRGFTGTTTDLRRHSAEVHHVLDLLWEKKLLHCDVLDGQFGFGLQWPNIPAYLNPKQFAEFYWPYQKQIIENLAKQGNKLYLLLEGRWMHLLDFFREVPKDSCILHCDDDNVVEISNRIGDYQIIAGGAILSKLKFATKDECIDDTKRVIDACAANGAFIFTTDKNWTCPSDINRNLFEVYQFAHEYGKY